MASGQAFTRKRTIIPIGFERLFATKSIAEVLRDATAWTAARDAKTVAILWPCLLGRAVTSRDDQLWLTPPPKVSVRSRIRAA